MKSYGPHIYCSKVFIRYFELFPRAIKVCYIFLYYFRQNLPKINFNIRNFDFTWWKSLISSSVDNTILFLSFSFKAIWASSEMKKNFYASDFVNQHLEEDARNAVKLDNVFPRNVVWLFTPFNIFQKTFKIQESWTLAACEKYNGKENG